MRLGTRIRSAALAALALTPLLSAFAAADDQVLFDGKPIRIVVNFPAGGPTDTMARVVAERMTASLKTTVIIDNKPGAGGNIGAAEVARSDPDGHTILAGIDSTFTINPAIYKSMPFKAEALKPLMIMASFGLLVGVNPSMGVRTLAELSAKAKKDDITFSSAGNGSPGHLAAEIFRDATAGKVTHVPYKGNAPAVLAVLSGEVQAGILSTPGMLPHVKAGKITPLAVTSVKRSLLMPEVPTVAEAGLKGLEFEVLQIAMLPAATPRPVVEALRAAMSEALGQPDVKSKLAQLDLIVENQSGAPAQQRIDAARSRYAAIIKTVGIQAE